MIILKSLIIILLYDNNSESEELGLAKINIEIKRRLLFFPSTWLDFKSLHVYYK